MPVEPTADLLVCPWREHLIDLIMPKWEVHMIAGPSGAGKTSFLIQFLETFRKGEKFYDPKHSTHPCAFVYVSGDRSTYGMYRTFERLGVEPHAYTLYESKETDLTVDHVLNNAVKASGRVKNSDYHLLLVVEGIATWVPEGKNNDYNIVARYLKHIGRWAFQNNCTVIGVTHSPKMKENDRYSNPRERINGSVAWGAYSDLILFIEPDDPEAANSLRTLYILPRNSAEHKLKLNWKDGLLKKVEMRKPNREVVLDYLTTLKPNDLELYLFTKQEAVQATRLPSRSVGDELEALVKAGMLERVKEGTYRLVQVEKIFGRDTRAGHIGGHVPLVN